MINLLYHAFREIQEYKENDIMDELNNLMQNEYEALVGMDIPMPDTFERAMKFIKTKVTKKEFIDIENAIYSGCVESEHKAFKQGFLRGIVVAKGSAA